MTSLDFTVKNPRTAKGIAIIDAAKAAMQGREPFNCPVLITIEWRLNLTKQGKHLPLAIYIKADEICQSLIGERFVICKAWQAYQLIVGKTVTSGEETLTVRIENI